MMALPRLVLLADGFASDPEHVRDAVLEAVCGGVRWVQLRDHGASDDAFRAAAAELMGPLRELDVLVSVNTRAKVAEALAAGLHVGRRGPAVREVERRPVGFSAHTLEEARQAAEEGADYVFASPIFATSSKPGAPGLGPEALRAFAARGVPVFALGGVTPERVARCRTAGAYGVAVLSGILHAPSPFDAARRYLRALETDLP